MLRKTRQFCCLTLASMAIASPSILLADWPGFLGPGGNAAVDQSAPTSFKIATEDGPAENVAWKIELPGRSVSGPIVIDGKVITTSSSAMEGRWMHVAAVDEQTGELLWQRSTKCTGRPFCHPTSANAAPTPCTDGERVYAFFSSNDVVCYDLDGNLQWFRSLSVEHPLIGNDVGMGSSPLVVDGVCVCSVECQGDSFLTGLDAQTGATLWEIPRPKTANWATPKSVADPSGNRIIVLHGGQNLVGIAPKSGAKLWNVEMRCSPVSTSSVVGNKIFVPSEGVKVYAIEDATAEPKLLSKASGLNTGYTSMVATPLGVIGINRSILVCIDEKEGEVRWKARLKDAGQIWSSPIIAGKHLYSFTTSGKCYTVNLSEEAGEVVAESELGAEVIGTPAINDGALFVRSVDALWKIGG
ncbi:MAG: PQQ-binding-like beta-propeller repeat protein [Aureliella sp.]